MNIQIFKMQKRKLGNTNIHLSAIGFGAAPIGDLFENLDETKLL